MTNTTMALLALRGVLAAVLVLSGAPTAFGGDESEAPNGGDAVAVDNGETLASVEAEDGASSVEGYVRIMPRFYLFSGDQGYLQRYRALDPPNENAWDRVMEVANEFAVAVSRNDTGVPVLELIHSNAFLLNDRWQGRWRPGQGSRLDVHYTDYQRPLEKFLPTPAPHTVSYAQRFNDDLADVDDLWRRRRDFGLELRLNPAAWSEALEVLRTVDLNVSRGTRTGVEQFNWIFGIVEDLVVPAGNNPARWRGRAEDLDQQVDRFDIGATFALGAKNLTWLRVFGDRFDNRAATVTNADIALIDPAINTEPNTINFVADSTLSGAELSFEQALCRRLTLTAEGSAIALEQESLSPFQSEAVYEGEITLSLASIALYLEASDHLELEGYWRWWKRENDTPVGDSSQSERPFLLRDRNLSGPFLQNATTTIWGGLANYTAKAFSLRLGARSVDSEREFIRATGTNAIPESLTLWNERSEPTSIWVAANSRAARRIRWSARYEYATAEETWSPADPARSHRLRAAANVTTKDGLAGVSLTGVYEDSQNHEFAYLTEAATVPQRWDVTAATAAVMGWWSVAPPAQLFAGGQFISRDQDSNLILTDVRRWRSPVVPELADAGFGYESEVWTAMVGATLNLGRRWTVAPSLSWVGSDGGIVSEATPVRDYTLIANDFKRLAIVSEYRLSARGRAHLQYGYERYDDDHDDSKSGTLQGIAVGYSFSF